jgi:RIO kinase 1
MNYNEEEVYPGGVSAVPEALRQYFDDGTIDGYERVLSEGKEAVVHVVSKSENSVRRYYAAKVYKKREERGFKNRGDYFVTQNLYKRRQLLAIRKKTRFGSAVEECAWQNRETTYLAELRAAGADVPVVIKAGQDAFIMEYLGDGDERALKLVEARNEIAAPHVVFARLMQNVELFLRCNIVHGDLSPYNILYHRGRVVIIDFPQASDPRRNPNAQALLQRDIRNVCAFFAKCSVISDPEALFSGMWAKYQLNEI